MAVDNNNKDLCHSIHEHVLDNRIADGTYYSKRQGGKSFDKTLEEQMHQLKRTKGKLCKNGCGRWVYLQEDESGRWRPYNQDDNEFHRCGMKPSKYKCHNCGNSIAFDQDKVSNSGKPIPLYESDLLPHQCPNDPFNTRR